MSKQTPTGTGEAPSPAAGHTVDDAALAFAAMLNPPEEDNQEASEEQPGAEAQDEETQEVEASGEEATGSEDEESGEEAAESEEQAEGEEEQGEEPAADQKFTVRVDGKDEQVELSELLAGYSRTSDYTRKTQALAQERTAFTQNQEAVRAERAEYAQLLPKLKAVLEAGMGPEPDWAKLKAEDPQQYLIARDEWNSRREQLNKIAQQERLTSERASKDREAQIEQVATEQHNKLLEKLPAWSDQKVATRESELIVKSLRAVGFSGDELEIFDHRAILIARKAALYDEMQAKQTKVTPKLKAAPVVKPGTAQRKPSADKQHKADRNRLQKTGSVRDAAKVFENLFK